MKQLKDMDLSKFPKACNIKKNFTKTKCWNEIIDKILESQCNFILIHLLLEIFKLLRKRILSFLVRKRNKKRRMQEFR